MNVVDYNNALDIAKAINKYIKIKDWVASTAYIVGQYVNNNGVLYKCTTANNDTTFDPTNWQKIAGGGLDEWESSTLYSVDDVVIYNNKIYQCNTAHTSGATFLPDEAKWTEISACITRIPNWVANEDYVVGDLVAHDAKIYRCTTAHTSGSTFDSTEEAKWEELSPTINEISLWAAATDYEVGQLVIYANKLFRCTTAHTSTSNFISDINNWQEISSNDIDNWQTSMPYKLGDFVYKDGQIYRCTTAHTSDSSNFYADITYWELLDTKWRAENWVASKYYAIGDVVLYDNRLFKCIVANTSSSNFAADYDKWSAISSKLELWKANTYYAVGDMVIYNNKLYRCKTGHTSTTTLSADIANWDLISSGTIDNWKSNEDYNVNSVVIYNNKIYQCKTSHSAGSTFDYSKWKEISSSDIDLWAANFDYIVGDIVIYDNQLYRCITAHTSTSNFKDTISRWQVLDTKWQAKDWAANTYYLVEEVVLYDNTPYKCITTHTSFGTFELDKANWTPLNANARIWTSGTSYKVGDTVEYNGDLYRCTTANNDIVFKYFKWYKISKCNIEIWKAAPDPNILALLHFDSPTYLEYNEYGVDFNKTGSQLSTNGRFGYAYNMNAANGTVYSPSYSFSNNESYTIEFWLYCNSDNYGRTSNSTIEIGNIGNALTFQGGAKIFRNTSYQIMSNNIIDAAWNYMTFVITPTTCTVYVNGIIEGTITRPNSYSTSVSMGGPTVTTTNTGTFIIDELCITKGAKYTSNFSVPTAPLLNPNYYGYVKDDLVVYEDRIYRALVSNNDNQFDPTKWVEVSSSSTPLWDSGTYYYIGDNVIYDNQTYRCIAAHTSNTFLGDIAYWQSLDTNWLVNDWIPNKLYLENQVVSYDDGLWKCLNTHISVSGDSPANSVIYTSPTNVIDVDDTTVIPYSETIDLGAIKKVTDITYNEVTTDMSFTYTIETSEDNITFTPWTGTKTNARYIKLTVDTVNIVTGATSPNAYLDDFTVVGESDNWEKISSSSDINYATDSDIDSLFD